MTGKSTDKDIYHEHKDITLTSNSWTYSELDHKDIKLKEAQNKLLEHAALYEFGKNHILQNYNKRKSAEGIKMDL